VPWLMDSRLSLVCSMRRAMQYLQNQGTSAAVTTLRESKLGGTRNSVSLLAAFTAIHRFSSASNRLRPSAVISYTLAHLPAHRVGSFEIFLGQRFVHEAQLSRPAPVTPGEIAAHFDGKAERLETPARSASGAAAVGIVS